MSTYSTNQFYGLTDTGEASLDKTSLDNPDFLWPSKSYQDSTGVTHTIQRGYMRSLLADKVANPETTMKNRRLFFQFNPQVLVRSVQQTPGAMLPLLQNPNQLLQPVPGTTSFAFEIMFNREHEVNSGFNPIGGDWDGLTLESGGQPLVSQIGVLADLMVLDSITGQGISKDMIDSVYANAQRQAEIINNQNAAIKEEYKKAGIDIDTIEFEEVDLPEQDDLKKMFEGNLGNSAFLNPIPFRVLFSSLFMVEGIANSVDVVFQKFSRNMVPTQCKVTINMYALYLGFAKKKTYLLDSISDNANDQQNDALSDTEFRIKLALSIASAKAWVEGVSVPLADYPNKLSPEFKVYDIKHTEFIRNAISKKEMSAPKMTFNLTYQFLSGIPTSPGFVPTFTGEGAGTLTLLKDGTGFSADKTEFGLLTTTSADRLWPRKSGSTSIFMEQMPNPRKDNDGDDYPVQNPAISFYVSIVVTAKNPETSNFISYEFKFPIQIATWHPTLPKVEMSYTNTNSSASQSVAPTQPSAVP
jgi:hypothetical protein